MFIRSIRVHTDPVDNSWFVFCMIRIENIYKDLGEFFLQDISLDINPEEYFIILGPTGAGKTILLETIAGIYHPDKGRIFINGHDITDIPPKDRNISMVYQDYMLFPHLTAKENIAFGLKSRRLSKQKIEQKIDETSQLLNISHLLHRYPATLSGGELQRIAIARALVIEPITLLLDEPLGALDTQTKEKLREELKKVHSITKTTTIHVTHSFEDAFVLGNRIAIMNEGKIIQVGKPNEVFRKPNSKFIANFVGVDNLFKGESVINNGISYININGINITSTTCKSGNLSISIRPEDILVSKQKIDSSARNSCKGKIKEIIDRGAIIKIVVFAESCGSPQSGDVGISFVVALTKQSFDDMNLTIDMPVYITFKASAVHLF